MLKNVIKNNRSTFYHNGFKRLAAVVIGLLVLTLYGCGGMKSAQFREMAPIGVPDRFEIDAVPFFPQEEYQCGPATLSMALKWSGIQVKPETVMHNAFTPSLKGSLQSALIGAARRHGRIAFPISRMNRLLAELASGHPVIVLQNLGLAWIPIWHYSLAIGYDLSNNTIILHSGRTFQKHLSMMTFERTWSRSDYWGLLILAPVRLPATAQENEYISAVTGLEQTKHWKEALEGYQTALKRWPYSLGAYVGIGNCYYALGEFKAAETVLKQAIDNIPNQGVLFNNLAQVQLKQKKYGEALESAQKAIQMGGPLVHLYQETLEEILSTKDLH